MLIFSKVNFKSMKIINEALDTFSAFSALAINIEKSNTYYSKVVQELHHGMRCWDLTKSLTLTWDSTSQVRGRV